MEILYEGCPSAVNLTLCDPTSCIKFNEQIYSDNLVVIVQASFSFIFFLIFIFCAYQTITDLRRARVSTFHELKLFYAKTPSIILSLVCLGAISRCTYFLEKIVDHYTLRLWDDTEKCCIPQGDRARSVILAEMLKMIRDISFSCSFILLVQSWIAVQRSLLPRNRQNERRYSKHKFIIVMFIYGLLRILECTFKIMDNLSNKQMKWVNILAFILRGLTMILYLAVFVYALPYGFGMLKRLNLALQQSSGISFKETSKGSRRKVDRSAPRAA